MVALVGLGEMGQAIAAGLNKRDVPWLEVAREKTPPLHEVELVVLAVKPKDLEEVCRQHAENFSGKVVVSCLAGVTLETLKEKFPCSFVVRAMMNLAVAHNQGVISWMVSQHFPEAQKGKIDEFLQLLGQAVEVFEESLIDATTALFGSGPGYLFKNLHWLEEKGVEFGFSPEVAACLAKQLVKGVAALVDEKSLNMWQRKVASSGGTTEACFQVWETLGVKERYLEGVEAAYSHFSKDEKVDGYFQKVKTATNQPVMGQDEVLRLLAKHLRSRGDELLAANRKDLACMDPQDPKYDRLLLNEARLEAIACDVEKISTLPSPLDQVLETKALPNGLHLKKVRVPLGVIGVIYESRPNVTFDLFALAFKTGNGLVLKGGKEAKHSNQAALRLIHDTLTSLSIDPNWVTLLPSTREATRALMRAHEWVDLLIPRGSQVLIDFVRKNAQVPLIETGAGVVHTYLDEEVDLAMAREVIVNAKTRRVSVCNALDTLLCHRSHLKDLPYLCEPLLAKGVKIWADEPSFAALSPSNLVHLATEETFGQEFLSLQMGIKTVDSMEEMLDHLRRYSSRHSEAILSKHKGHIEHFLNQVDAAVVYVNASTAFTDGGAFGMGGEVGISTQKLHARGPMGLAELTSYQWQVTGKGHVRP